ncbi:MAG: hypothetical protein JSU72_15720 [Deltaproteobacteria bacterium]|nr:MAG: hypothetical protein JSU72_15720 [Deltaproteobacteria bacterium]
MDKDGWDKDKRKKHLRLVQPKKSRKLIGKLKREQIDTDIPERLESVDWQILTGPPDATVIIDDRAPLEVKLRVVAAVKSYTLGIKSVDHALKQYGESWEAQLSGNG